jgi:cytosine deaminase
LQANSPPEAIRLRAARLAVVRRGKVIARAPASDVVLDLPGRPASVNFRR